MLGNHLWLGEGLDGSPIFFSILAFVKVKRGGRDQE